MSLSDNHPHGSIRDVGIAEQPGATPRNPVKLPFPSELVGNSTGRIESAHQTVPVFDATVFANSSEFSSAEMNTVDATASIDWEHADRMRTGSSILDANSVTDESGRTFHGYKEGKYFLPNDAVGPP